MCAHAACTLDVGIVSDHASSCRAGLLFFIVMGVSFTEIMGASIRALYKYSCMARK